MKTRKLPQKTPIHLNYLIPNQEESTIKIETGETISFKFKIDTELENRGWVVNEVTMFIDDIEAGYLKMSYIPEGHWDYYKGTLVKWLAQQNKIYINYVEEDSLEYKKSIAKAGYYYKGYNVWNDIEINIDKMSEEEINYHYSEGLRFLKKEFQVEYNKDKEFFVEKPLVDFSRII